MNTGIGTNDASKRTRFDPSVLQVSTSNRQPPKSLALAFIKRCNSSLRDNLADLLNDHSTKHITHNHCIWEKEEAVQQIQQISRSHPKIS